MLIFKLNLAAYAETFYFFMIMKLYKKLNKFLITLIVA